MRNLSTPLQAILVVATISLGLIATEMVMNLAGQRDWHPLLLLLIIGALELLGVDIFPRAKNERMTLTLGILGRFFVLSLYGPDWAVAATIFHTLLTGWRMRSSWYKTLYNLGITTSSMWAAARLMSLPMGANSLIIHGALVGAAVVGYVFVVNSSTVLAIALSARQSFQTIWRSNMAWATFQELTLAFTGYALGHAVGQLGWTAALLGSPLFLLRLTYQSYLRNQIDHTRELESFASQLIDTLAAMVDARDAFTFGHSTHVARYATAMAQRLGYQSEQLERLRVGALLHDIGKVGVPESILFKPGKLEHWEYERMKEHAAIGYRIVSGIKRLQFAADIIYQHHEWYGGGGYPRGLKGEEILLDARIVGVADTLEAMISDRPYRRGRSVEEALAEIRRCSGTQFDPQVVRALERVVQDEDPSFFVNSAVLVSEAHAAQAQTGQRIIPIEAPVRATAASTQQE